MIARFKKNIGKLVSVVLIIAMAFQSIAAPVSFAGPAAAEPAKVTGTWSQDAAGNWSFRSQEGAAKDGWYYLNTGNHSAEYNWFCFDANGVMRTGWVPDKNDPSVWYYTGESKDGSEGGLVKGWITDPQDGKKYYLDPSTGIMCHGWKQISGVWYYFGESRYADRRWGQDSSGYWTDGKSGKHTYGALYMNEYTPDGYYVGANGAWVQNHSEDDHSDKPDPIPAYGIIVEDDGHGTAKAQVGGAAVTSAAPGAAVTLVAKANDGYAFKEWQIVRGLDSITGNSFTMPSNEVKVKAVFEKEYAVEAEAGGHGTVSVDVAKGVSGKEVNLTITPDEGYEVDQITVVRGGVTVTGNKFNIGTADVKIRVTFKAIVPSAYGIIVEDDGHGTAKAQVGGADVTSAAPGAAVTLVATANDGYAFKEWQIVRGLEAGAITDNSFTMPSNEVKVKAVFEKEYAVEAEAGGHGTVSADVAKGVSGKEVNLTITPDAGYETDQITVVRGGVTVVDNKFNIGTADVKIRVTFKAIVPSAYGIIVEDDGHGTASADPTSAAPGATVNLTATPNDGYAFKEWQIGRGLEAGAITDNSFTMPSNEVKVKAVFERVYNITLQTNEHGTASATVGGKTVTTAAASTEVALTATPDEGYQFKEWNVVSGGITVKDDKFTMPAGNVTIQAVFEAKTPLPAGALKGEFSVSATKKVHFSQGNLVATIDATGAPTAWKFAANQYESIGANVANTKIGKEAGDIDLFGWSTDAASNNWGIHTKTNPTNKFTTGNFKDWGKAVGDGNTWRTLSKAEWKYLFNNHSKKWATVNGVTGYVIAPDGFAGTLSDTYADDAALAANNLVFLPAAGDRAAFSVTVFGSDGFYWSSSTYSDDETYDLHFTDSSVKPDRTDKRNIGMSVRLVTEVKAPATYTVTFASAEHGAIYDAATSGQKVPSISVASGTAVSTDGNKITIGDTDYYAVADSGYKFKEFSGSVPKTITAATTITPVFEADTLPNGFYLIPITDNTTITDTNIDMKLSEDESVSGQYKLDWTFNAGDKIKVVKVENNAIAEWYPDGIGTEYTIQAGEAGERTLLFSTEYKNEWSAWGGYFKVQPKVVNYTVTFATAEHGAVYDAATSGQKVPSISVASGTAVSTDGNKITIGDTDYYAVADSGYKFKEFTGTVPATITAAITITPVFEAKTPLPAGALKGEFSVSATKKVHFSQGNLTYNVTNTKWAFYEHQYDCATGYDSNLISLFTWGYDAVKSIVPYGTTYVEGHTDETFSKTEDWGYVFGGESSVWHTLTKDEWLYLFNNHSKKWATVNGVKGYVIAPDGFAGTLSSTYTDDAALVANNLVFLPAAGNRDYTDVYYVGTCGNYWSSTATDIYSANYVYFDTSSVNLNFDSYRQSGFSVRLVTEVKAPAAIPTFKAVYNTTEGANTLTFYYDNKDHSGENITVYDNLPTAATQPSAWDYNSNRNEIKSVVINSSVAGYDGLTSTAYMFQGMKNAVSISGAEYLDVSNVTDMTYMFQNFGGGSSGSPTTLNVVPDVRKWNTSNVTNMSGMFAYYGNNSNLDKVPDVSGWNTGNVTDMTFMFQKYGHESQNFNAVPDVSNWNTGNVTNMANMFYEYGHKSTSLGTVPDVSGWNTGKVENMQQMFYEYGKASTNISCVLDLSGWDLSKITETHGEKVFNFNPKTFNVTIPAKTGEKSNEGDKWYYGDGTNTIAPPEGKKFTPAKEMTVADVLETAAGGFSNSDWIYESYSCFNEYSLWLSIAYNDGNPYSLTKLTDKVTLEDDNWTCTTIDEKGKVTFNMTDEALTSITVSGTEVNDGKLNGEYVPQAKTTVAGVLPDNFPTSKDAGWKNEHDYSMFKDGSNLVIHTDGGDPVDTVPLETVLTKGDGKLNCYASNGSFTFNMNGDNLVSIEYSYYGWDDYYDADGTYVPVAATPKYMDWDAGKKELVEKPVPADAIEVTNDTNFLQSGKFYIVKGADVQTGTLTVNGTATLILMDGAKLTATGGTQSAGINVVSDKTLIITGQKNGTGILVANGNYATGIGGGSQRGGGTVTINGGTVTANGGDECPGIGGGSQLGGGTVTINGGTVTANGGAAGAGIGGGYGGNGGTVIINGGTVIANGGAAGAGIGGGYGGNGGTVTINGGTVTATGGDAGYGAVGAAIGMGAYGSSSGTLTFAEGVNFTIKAGADKDNTESKTTAQYSEDHSAAYVSIEESAAPATKTVAEVLATVENFPDCGDWEYKEDIKIPEKAWTNNDSFVMFKGNNPWNGGPAIVVIDKTGEYDILPAPYLSNELTQNGNSWVITNASDITYSFNMENDKLVSITVSGSDMYDGNENGTYTAPAAPAPAVSTKLTLGVSGGQTHDAPMAETEVSEPTAEVFEPEFEPEKFEEAKPEELIEPAEAVAEEAAP